MPFENGEWWNPIDPDKRGRHASFGGALDAVLAEMLTEHDPFFDSLADVWNDLFADLPALRPGRYEDGKIFLYVRTAPARFAMQSKLALVRRRLAALPGAPAKIDLRLEIHADARF